MCGILGGNNPRWDYEKGIQSIRHRGPDGQRVESYDGLTLAFARLAIMDLSENGMQPMTSMDGNVTIVYNGEIYGYDKLRRELEHKYPFRIGYGSNIVCIYGIWGQIYRKNRRNVCICNLWQTDYEVKAVS